MFRRRIAIPAIPAILALLTAACADDLAPADDGPDEPEITDGHISQSLNPEDGTWTTTVDATSFEEWIYYDLDGAAETTASSTAWDLAFQRMNVAGNGAEGVAVAWIEGAIPSPDLIPAEGAFLVEPSNLEDSVSESSFQTDDPWYSYEISTHTLTPHARVYFVRSGEGALFALTFLGYYDAAGTAAVPSFRWGSMGR